MKTLVLGIMPLLLISGTGGDWTADNVLNENGLLVSFGEQEVNLPSVLVFQERVEELRDGSLFPTLMLNVPQNKELKELELVISDGNKASVDNGIYEIAQVSSFLEHVSKVFGVANYNAWGELPFFATSGNVRIVHKEERQLFGYVQLECQNEKGEKITIDGPFTALKAIE